MRSFFAFIYFLLLIQVGLAQNQFGKVTYKINTPGANEWKDKIMEDDMADANKKYIIENIIKTTITTLPHVELELFFTPYEAILNIENYLKNDNKLDIKNALGRTNTNGTYYSNIKENLFLHETVFFEPYLIKTPFNELEWEIHDETKEILGYTCIKATTTLEYPFNDFPTTAWFAPELPFPFGPKEFRGLPGLILAMEFNYFYFYASAIDLDIKSMRIKKPSKGIEISRTKYFEELKEHDRAFLKSVGRKREETK